MAIKSTILTLFALTLAGCTSPLFDPSDASNWTIELASSENAPSGLCQIYDANQVLMIEGSLASGKMDGTWTTFSSNGDRNALISYHEGVRSGPVQMWYGAFAYPEAHGHLKLVGTFLDGYYEGTVTRFYPSGEKRGVREYANKTLTSARYWSPNGNEESTLSAQGDAASDFEADLKYFTAIEGMVPQALAHANRRIHP